MTTITLDVTSQESIVACETEVRKVTNGNLNVLVNNAYVALFYVSSLPFLYTKSLTGALFPFFLVVFLHAVRWPTQLSNT